jgi:hypothetical protein
MDIATVKVAKELYTMPHEFMHWHECGLLGGTKPTNHLVANIWEPANCLKVVPNALVKVFLSEVPSEVQSKMIFMGHQISSCLFPVVRSFFILWKMLLKS